MVNVEHPFLQSLDYVFQTEFRLFFVMPFLAGGDLYDNLLQRTFTEEQVKFYMT